MKNSIKKLLSENDFLLNVLGIIIFLMAFFIQDLKESLRVGMYIISYIMIGFDIFKKALKHLFKKDMFDENLLMFVATIGAILIGEYIEGIAVLLFYKIGEYLQDKAVDSSKEKIQSAIDIRAQYANLKLKNNIKVVKPEELKVGDTIIVKTGEKIPVDTIVLEGTTDIDTSSLTGESLPIQVQRGDKVLSGCINLGGVIELEVIREYENSAAYKIIDLIQNATNNKSKTENFITRFSKSYTPIVIVIAFIIALTFPAIFNISFTESINRSLIFLVISCPCALILSVPLGFFVGIGNCSRKGILVKGSNYLDILSNVDTLVFDKTGTLTKGTFNVTKINNKSKNSDDEILEIISLCESYSNHYIAKSIVDAYNGNLDKSRVSLHKEIAGHGIEAVVDGKNVLVGNYTFLKDRGVNIQKENGIGTVVYLAINNEYIGNIILSDELKDDIIDISQKLKHIGIKRNILLTGDNKDVAEDISEKLKFDEVYFELLPQDKVDILEKIKKNHKVAYIGDGINDAPVLASADVGISMGKGSDVAIETSDIVLMTDEPNKLIDCIKTAKRTKRIVIENITFALTVKILVLLLSAMGITTMWEAIFADVGVSLIAILNSIRIFRK